MSRELRRSSFESLPPKDASELSIIQQALTQRTRPASHSNHKISSPKKKYINSYEDIVVQSLIDEAKFSIYLVSNRYNNERYAMKLFPFIDGKPDHLYTNEARFHKLSHPNIIEVVGTNDYEEINTNGTPMEISFILTDYAPHGDFSSLFQNTKRRLPEKVVRTYFHQLMSGLQYLHSQEIAHLDLKLKNLLLGSDYQLLIADFDFAMFVDGEEKVRTQGTPGYRAPELFMKKYSNTGGFAMDIHTAAIVLFRIMTGGIPPYSEKKKIGGYDMFKLMHTKNEEFWRAHTTAQKLSSDFFSESFIEMFNSMTSFEPEKRPTAEQVLKGSKWLQGSILSTSELAVEMHKFLN